MLRSQTPIIRHIQYLQSSQSFKILWALLGVDRNGVNNPYKAKLQVTQSNFRIRLQKYVSSISEKHINKISAEHTDSLNSKSNMKAHGIPQVVGIEGTTGQLLSLST